MGQIQTQRTTPASHLSNDCHKMCWCGFVVQSLTRFDSKDPAVPINGELGKWGGLIMLRTKQSAVIKIAVDLCKEPSNQYKVLTCFILALSFSSSTLPSG